MLNNLRLTLICMIIGIMLSLSCATQSSAQDQSGVSSMRDTYLQLTAQTPARQSMTLRLKSMFKDYLKEGDTIGSMTWKEIYLELNEQEPPQESMITRLERILSEYIIKDDSSSKESSNETKGVPGVDILK